MIQISVLVINNKKWHHLLYSLTNEKSAMTTKIVRESKLNNRRSLIEFKNSTYLLFPKQILKASHRQTCRTPSSNVQ